MGRIFETERMQRHVAGCEQCEAAGNNYSARCDAWHEMLENVIDFENAEGPWEGREGWRMCDRCDGAVDPSMGLCPGCGYVWCVFDTHECSSSDCDEVEYCGQPGVDGHPYCERHQTRER